MNLSQILISICAIGGNLLIAFNSPILQLIAFSVWIIANLISIPLLWKSNLKILAYQNMIFFLFNIFGIYQRL